MFLLIRFPVKWFIKFINLIETNYAALLRKILTFEQSIKLCGGIERIKLKDARWAKFEDVVKNKIKREHMVPVLFLEDQ